MTILDIMYPNLHNFSYVFCFLKKIVRVKRKKLWAPEYFMLWTLYFFFFWPEAFELLGPKRYCLPASKELCRVQNGPKLTKWEQKQSGYFFMVYSISKKYVFWGLKKSRFLTKNATFFDIFGHSHKGFIDFW